MTRVLVTSMGGSGSNNLVNSMRMSDYGRRIYFVGTHADDFELACSVAEINYLVAFASEEQCYIEETAEIIRAEQIDLIIPNSDREAHVVSKYRGALPCKKLLPDHEVIEAVQDKFQLYEMLKRNQVHTAETYEIDALDNIEASLQDLPAEAGRFWIRIRAGYGSIAATWVKTAQQARSWIELWQQLQGIDLGDFLISEFLPGRDFNVHTLWRSGELLAAKICQRLAYYSEAVRLSGMSSTPRVAMTIDNREALNEAIKAVRAVSKEFDSVPNGAYNLDLKENYAGEPCITEINIGRFPTISPIFDRTGRHNMGELYVRAALGESTDDGSDAVDIEPDVYMIRGLDKEPMILREEEFRQLFHNRKGV